MGQESCEVRVLPYCILSNHFHILVEGPYRLEVLPTSEKIVAKFRQLSGERFMGAVQQQFALYRRRGTRRKYME